MMFGTADRNVTLEAYDLPFNLWVIYEVFAILLTVTALYVCIVLAHFSYVKNYRRSPRRIPKSSTQKSDRDYSSSNGGGKGGSNSSVEGGSRRRNDGTGKAAKPLRCLCLSAAVFALIRITSDQMELATYGNERVDCKIYQVVVVVTYAISATFNYTALWVRLRVFINHPVMNHLASKFIRCVVWLALAAIVGSSLLNTLIFTITTSAVDSKLGCRLGNSTSISPLVRYVILTVSSVTTQGLLLALFLYPLLKHKSSMKSSTQHQHPRLTHIQNNDVARVRNLSTKSESDSDIGKKSRSSNGKDNKKSFRKSKKIKREKRLLSIMQRVLVTAIICVASDIVTAIVTLSLFDQPRVVSNMVFNFNLLINTFSVLCSFGDWQDRIFPCCSVLLRRNRRKRRHASTSSVATQRIQMENEDPQAQHKKRIDTWRLYHDSSASIPPVVVSSGGPSTVESKQDDVFVFEKDAVP